jgi:hypothetical protein
MAPGRGAYRIKVTFRFKVRRRERFVEKKGPTKRKADKPYRLGLITQ